MTGSIESKILHRIIGKKKDGYLPQAIFLILAIVPLWIRH